MIILIILALGTSLVSIASLTLYILRSADFAARRGRYQDACRRLEEITDKKWYWDVRVRVR